MAPPGIGFGELAGPLSATLAAPAFWIAAVGLFAVFVGARVGAVAFFGVAGEPSAARWRRATAPLLWGAGLPAAALLIDGFSFSCTAPPLAAAGLGLGGLVAARRCARLVRRVTEPDPWRRALALLGCVVPLLLLGHWIGASGDEPHYLIVTHSMLADGDLDVGDDYADRVYAPYHPTRLSPHYKPGLVEGSRYSMHGVGLPAALLPAYALGARIGGNAAVTASRGFLALLYGFFVWSLYGLVAECAGPRAARWGTGAATLLAPLIFAPLFVFPEVAAMILGLAAFRELRRPIAAPLPVAAAGCLAALPWLGVKYIPLAAALVLVGIAAARPGTRWRRAMTAGAPLAASLGLHSLYTLSLYGSLSPAAVYLGTGSTDPAPALGGSWLAYLAAWPGGLATLAGFLMDQKEGVLAYGPHFIFTAAGLGWLWRRSRFDVVAAAAIIAAYVGPYALSQQLGGQGPPVRPLMAVLWVVVPALGIGLTLPASQRWINGLRGGLLALASMLTVAYASQPYLLPHDYPVKVSRIVQAYTPFGSGAWRFFPQWVNIETSNWRVTTLWSLIVIAAAVALWRFGASASLDPVAWRGGGPATEPDAGERERAGPAGPASKAGIHGRSVAASAAAAVVAASCAFVVVQHVMIIRTDRHRPVPLASGPTAWVAEELPETAWAESGGVWVTPGRPIDFILTTEEPLATLDVSLRVLVPAEVAAFVQGVGIEGGATPRANLVGRLMIGPGRRDRGGFAYQCRVSASRGAAPADLAGGRDERYLGAFFEILGSTSR